MKRCFLGLLVLPLVMAAGVANAQYFKISNRAYGAAGSNAQAKAQVDNAFNKLEDEVNKVLADTLNTKDLDKYLDGTAKAFTLTNKGVGVDYGSDMKLFTVGVGLAVGFDTTDLGLSDVISGDAEADQINGMGANLSLYAGLNMGFLPFDLGPIKMNRTKVFVNLMSYEADDLGDIKGKAEVSSFGAHVQYKLIEPVSAVSSLIAKWNGVDVTGGLDMSSLKISAKKDNLNAKTTQTVANQSVDVEFDGEANVGIDISTFSIPVEISTGGNLFYFLGAYVGLGVDINAGSAEPQGKVSGDISSPQDPGIDGTASLDVSKEGEPSAGTMRLFAGLEINAAILKVFARYQQTLNDDTMGLTLGVSGGW